MTGVTGPVSAKLSNLGLRALSAAVLAPVVLGAVWFGGPMYYVLLGAVSIPALLEWQKVCGSDNRFDRALYSGLGPAVVALALIGGENVAIAATAGGAAAAALLSPKRDFANIWRAVGMIYIGVPLVALLYIRGGNASVLLGGGRDAVFFLLAAVWASDIGAYGIGRLIGGPKLAPRISPSKTWAGAVGGTATAGLAVIPVYNMGIGWVAGQSWLAVFFMGAALAIASQIGDLFESSVKRHFGVKDTGTLIPGHGGILDRIDGLLAAAPLMALVVWYAARAGS